MGVSDWLIAVASASGDVLTLRGARSGAMSIPSLPVAAGIALFSGISTLLGHSVVLYLNRVRGLRFVAALVLGAVLLTLLYLVQAGVLALVAPLIAGTGTSFGVVAALTLASTAPLLFGFFEFVPVFGLIVGRLLQVWSALCLWALIATAYSLGWWGSLAVTVAAWLVMQVLSRLLGPAVGKVTARIWSTIAGRPTLVTGHDILAGAPLVPIDSEKVASPERAPR